MNDLVRIFQCVLLGVSLALAFGIAGAEEQVGRDSAVKPAAVTLQDRFADVAMPPRSLDTVARVGERLHYLIRWKGVPAGRASFAVKRRTRLRGEPVYYLTLETESNDAISLLYPVRDKVKSYVCAETGHSLLFVRNLREGSYKADDTLQFDYEDNVQLYSAVKYDSELPREKQKPPRPIPGPLQDPLSVLYYLRHFPLAVGETKDVVVGTRKRTGILRVEVVGEEEVSLPGIGVFDANRVRLGTAENETYEAEIFVSKGDITLLAEKHTNIPLEVSIGLPILGSARAVLFRAEGTRLESYRKRDVEP